MRAQPPEDVPLHAESPPRCGARLSATRLPLDFDAELVRTFLVPIERQLAGDTAHEVRPFHRRQAARPLDERLRRARRAGRDHAAHHAARAQLARERTRVDVGNGDNMVGNQVVAQRAFGSPVARNRRLLADDESGDLGHARLDVLWRDAVVADLGTGHRHDLSRVGGIGQHFLITGHARVEHDFAAGFAFGPGRDTLEPGSIFERENRFQL